MELPITNSIIIAIAKLVDDVQVESRQPTHSDLDVQFKRAGLIMFAPKTQGALVGKAKRVTAVLNWAIENDKKSGSRLIELLLSQIKGDQWIQGVLTKFHWQRADTERDRCV